MNKQERFISEQLHTIHVPAYDTEKKERTKNELLSAIKNYKISPEEVFSDSPLEASEKREKHSFFEFYFGQLRYIHWDFYVINLAVLLLAFLVFIVEKDSMLDSIYDIFFGMILAPFFLIPCMKEIAAVFRPGIAELETTTKYTMNHIFSSRLVILGMNSILFLLAYIVLVRINSDMSFLLLLSSAIVPFNISAIAMLTVIVLGGDKQLLAKIFAVATISAITFWAGSMCMNYYVDIVNIQMILFVVFSVLSIVTTLIFALIVRYINVSWKKIALRVAY